MKILKKGILLLSIILFIALLTACAGDSSRTYDVTFQVNGGESVPGVTVSVIDEAPVAARLDYAFAGWYFNEELTVKAVFPLTITRDTVLYAKWEKLYKVVYRVKDNMGTQEYPDFYHEGDEITIMSDPQKDGYTFGGWKEELPALMPAKDIIINGELTPNKYYICFNVDGDTVLTGTTAEYTTTVSSNKGVQTTFPAIEVTFGQSYSIPFFRVAAEKENQDFDCWTYTLNKERIDYEVTMFYTEPRNILLTPKWAQLGTAGLEFTLSEDGKEYSVTRYTRNNQKVIIPATYQGKPVTAIGDYAFVPNIATGQVSQLTEVHIPASVTKIGAGAFMSCTKLSNIVYTTVNNIKEIGGSAFRNCSSLTTFTLPSTVKILSEYTFADCDKLETFKINGANLLQIGAGAFSKASSLKSITLPSSVLAIGNFAFEDCAAMTAVNDLMFTRITQLGAGTFKNCVSLETVTLPSTCSKIDQQAFMNCKALRQVNIPDAVRIIEIEAFAGCESLVRILLSANIVEIKPRAFFGCTRLLIQINISVTDSLPSNWHEDWDLLRIDSDEGEGVKVFISKERI